MTVQFPEVLRVEGHDYAMLDTLYTPLDRCRDTDVRERMGNLREATTAHRRGYVGHWEVKRKRLWLIGLSAFVFDPGTGKTEWYDNPRALRWLFPDRPAPVFAEWFTGELASPRGRRTRAQARRGTWPHVRVFRVEGGRVLGTELRPWPQPEQLVPVPVLRDAYARAAGKTD